MSDEERDGIEIVEAIAATPKTCWRALTEASLIAKWWGSHVKLDARTGGRLEERWSNGDREVLTSGTVHTAEPLARLELDWADDDWPGSTQVSFRIEPVDDSRTEMRFAHMGWSIFPEEQRKQLIAAHRGGWENYLQRYSFLCQELAAGQV